MKRLQQGLSLVELMVGLALGLMIVATASVLMDHQLHDSRRLQLETQLDQDLRAAADLIARELRRAGYTQHAARGANPYAEVGTGRQGIEHARASFIAGEDDGRLDPADRSGAKLENGTLRLKLGDAGWQAITDADVVKVSRFSVSVHTRTVPLADYCTAPCPPAAGSACPPVQEVREAQLALEGHAVQDPRVQRSLQATVRLRNDRITGHCA